MNSESQRLPPYSTLDPTSLASPVSAQSSATIPSIASIFKAHMEAASTSGEFLEANPGSFLQGNTPAKSFHQNRIRALSSGSSTHFSPYQLPIRPTAESEEANRRRTVSLSSQQNPALKKHLFGNEKLSSSNSNLSTGSSDSKRLNYSTEVRAILLKWLLENKDHPYPNDSQKTELMELTSLSMQQVNNWFINARRRKYHLMSDHGSNSDGEHARRRAFSSGSYADISVDEVRIVPKKQQPPAPRLEIPEVPQSESGNQQQAYMHTKIHVMGQENGKQMQFGDRPPLSVINTVGKNVSHGLDSAFSKVSLQSPITVNYTSAPPSTPIGTAPISAPPFRQVPTPVSGQDFMDVDEEKLHKRNMVWGI